MYTRARMFAAGATQRRMKAAPMPEEHVEIGAAEVKPPEEIEGE